MYQVISRGVIRAALRSMNMPPVTLELCQNFTFPNGTRTCAYRARFNSDLAEKRVREEWKRTKASEFCFDELLEECFCRDITVIPEPTYPWTGEITYILICRLSRKESEMTASERYREDYCNTLRPSQWGELFHGIQTVISDSNN